MCYSMTERSTLRHTRQWENVLFHDGKVYTEALSPVVYITEFADGAEHFTPPDKIMK